MNSLAVWLDASGRGLVAWLGATSSSTAALLVGALVLDLVLARRVRASWRLALYVPMLVRVLVPPGWSIAMRDAPRAMTFLTPVPVDLPPPLVGAGASTPFGWPALACATYAVVALLLAVAFVGARHRTRRLLASARRASGPVAALVHPYLLLQHEQLGPMVVGLLSPCIVVPSALLDDAAALALVLRHEKAHLLRKDPWLSATLQVMLVALWPVLPLWIAAWRLRQLMELACDERALMTADESERRRYGHTLLDLAEKQSAGLTPLSAELRFGASLRSRIEALVSHRKRWPLAVQVGLVGALAAGFAACASVGPASTAPATAWKPPPSGKLQTYDDLKTYCAPFMAARPAGANWNDAWNKHDGAGLPAEQDALCRDPQILVFEGQEAANEGRNALGQIGLDFARAYELRGRKLCPSGPPIPARMKTAGEKYQPRYNGPSDTEWNDNAGWQCINFAMSAPMFFQYELSVTSDAFSATARAQLLVDGRERKVTMVLRGVVKDGDLHVAPTIEETWDPI